MPLQGGEDGAQGDEWQRSGIDDGLDPAPLELETPRGSKRESGLEQGSGKKLRQDYSCDDLEDWLAENGRSDLYKLLKDKKGKWRAFCLICPAAKNAKIAVPGFKVSRTSWHAIHHHEQYTYAHEAALKAIRAREKEGGASSTCGDIVPFQPKPCSKVSEPSGYTFEFCEGLQLIGCRKGIFKATEVHHGPSLQCFLMDSIQGNISNPRSLTFSNIVFEIYALAVCCFMQMEFQPYRNTMPRNYLRCVVRGVHFDASRVYSRCSIISSRCEGGAIPRLTCYR